MIVDAADLETHRRGIVGHCYRMLGAIADAEDAAQDTMVRAWQNLHRFEGRAALRTWLYRIATNVCLDALSSRSRRMRPIEEGPVGSLDDVLEARPRTHWLEPVPESRVVPADADPFERVKLRQSVRLAFVAALQHLPPRQRAALLLAEVVGWSAAEIAEGLDMSVPAVTSAIQRARATLAARRADLPSGEVATDDAELLERYVDAFHRYDVEALVSLMRDDVVFSMPPYTLWLQGPDAVRGWLHGRGAACRGSRLLPVAASGQPAFAHYKPAADGGFEPWGLVVLEPASDSIAAWTTFLDAASLFPHFGLPPRLPA